MRHSVLRAALAALLAVFAVLLAPAASLAQTASPCPPGQPPGRPPGVPPGPPQNIPPSGRGQYPPGECNLLLSQSAAQRGQTVTASGSGFVPGESVELRLEPGGHVLAASAADADGRITRAFVVPASANLGRNDVLATSATRELSAALDVLPAAAETSRGSTARAAGSSLARTGATVAATAVTGVGLVALGVFALAAAKRRLRTNP